MSLLTSNSAASLWRKVLKDAQQHCSVVLDSELEAYLVSLLTRYTNKPDISKQVFARAFLQAMQHQDSLRNHSLQQVGDQCLIFAGLFPQRAKRKLIKIDYFIDLGRSAYSAVTGTAADLFNVLALEFVMLMDVLQSIRNDELMPMDAYEQWELVGSQRALRILNAYSESRILPIKGKF